MRTAILYRVERKRTLRFHVDVARWMIDLLQGASELRMMAAKLNEPEKLLPMF